MQNGEDQRNKHGVPTKAIFIKQLEEEYWELLAEIKKKFEKKSTADAVRYALKKATGRV